MFRKYFNHAKSMFVLLAVTVAPAYAAKPKAAVKLAATTTTYQAYTVCWAGLNNQPQLISDVEALKQNGVVSGYFGVSGSNWDAMYGQCYALSFSDDALGHHSTVNAYVSVDTPSLSGEPGIATFVMTKHPDGSTSVGIEVTDYFTNAVLETTGRNAKGVLNELPVFKGGMFMAP